LIDRGIVIHGCAEEGDHPFVDVIQSVVAQPIRQSCSRDCRREAVGLRLVAIEYTEPGWPELNWLAKEIAAHDLGARSEDAMGQFLP